MPRRRGPGTVLGPLFRYELLAATRRGRHAALRCAVGAVMLAALFTVYSAVSASNEVFADPFGAGPTIPAREQAQFAEAFAVACLAAQFLLVLALTPAWVADVIVREKERRSLEYLFVTDLNDREIVVGKLAARLAYLAATLLTGLPVLALTQLFGGVDPVQLVSAFGTVFVTLISLGSACIMISVHARTTVSATMSSYAAALLYLAAGGTFLRALFTPGYALTVFLVYLTINLFFMLIMLVAAIGSLRSATLGLAPPGILVPVRPHPEALTQLLATRKRLVPHPETGLVVLSDWNPFLDPAAQQFEPLYWRQPLADSLAGVASPKPPVDGKRPLLWKELHVDSPFRMRVAAAGPHRSDSQPAPGCAIGVLLVAACLLLSVFPNVFGFWATTGYRSLIRVATVLLAAAFGVCATYHAANSVCRERERDTLGGLLALPVERRSILLAKWWAGPLAVRWLAYLLAVVWLFGTVTTLLHPLVVPALLLACAAPVAFLVSLGLLISVLSRTAMQANLGLALSVLLVAAGPFIVLNYVEMMRPPGNPVPPEWRRRVIDALTPPVTCWKLAVGPRGFDRLTRADWEPLLAGPLVYATAAWLCWRAACWRFAREG
jgi:ABC-type Na+ efflux pump permease subunit